MKIKNMLCALAVLLVAGLAAIGTIQMWNCSRENPPVGLGIEDASTVVDSFCQALNDGDYETIDSMIYLYSSVNLASEPEDRTTAKLFDCLKDSLVCRTVGEASVSGRNARQDIEVKYFSINRAANDVKVITQYLYEERMEQAQSNEELYDSTGNLLESVAMEIYDVAIEQVIKTPEKYMVSDRITVELVYENGGWEVVLSEDLVQLLLGAEQ